MNIYKETKMVMKNGEKEYNFIKKWIEKNEKDWACYKFLKTKDNLLLVYRAKVKI